MTDLTIVDGLLVSKWSRGIYDAMQKAGITAANCTCAVWEGFDATMRNIAAFKRAFEEHGNVIRQVYTVDDIYAARRESRSGVILGFQNTSPIEDRLEYLALFDELGVRIAQLTYNTTNYVGSGCYENRDGGLTDFGCDVIAEMNRLGMLIDLSHVGARTARDAIAESRAPVAFTHVCPAALKPHRRNKSDDDIKAVADAGGVVGVTFLSWFLAAGEQSTIEDYLDALEHTINLAGEDHVAIGTDFTEGHGPDFVEWILRDKGTGRPLLESPITDVRLVNARGLERIEDLGALPQAMERRGWSRERIEKVLGENWMRLFRDTWRSEPNGVSSPPNGKADVST